MLQTVVSNIELGGKGGSTIIAEWYQMVFWLQYFVVHQYYSSFVLCRSIYASVSYLLLLVLPFLLLCFRWCSIARFS